MSNADAKIVISGVRKSFQVGNGDSEATLALDGIDLTVADGEFVSLLGPSGCGKTTLLRIIAGLTAADAGSVEVNGKAVDGPGRDRAMVFQAFGLLPWRTVAQNVAFPLKIRKLPKSEIDERTNTYLKLVNLERFKDRSPHQLSGGMQPRVGLARALAVDPEVLLMDEPFGAIDAQQRELMQEELLRIWDATGKTIVLVTHDLDEAVYLSDRVVLLSPHPGRVRTVVDVALPPPRGTYDARSDERFVEVRSEIWSVLRKDVIDVVEREAAELEERMDEHH